MSVESYLKEANQWKTILQIEVYTGLCRLRVIKDVNRLVLRGKVARQRADGGTEYRWIGGE